MPLPTIPNILRVTFNWQFPNFTAANVLHFLDPGYLISETDFIEEMRSHLTDLMFDPISNAGEIASYDVIKLDGVSATVHVSDPAPQTGGTVSSEYIPNTGPVIALRSTERSRRKRGRVFLPGVAESQSQGGQLTTGTVADLEEGWNTFRDDMEGVDLPLMIASYVDESATNVSTCSSRTRCGTQRRRQTRAT